MFELSWLTCASWSREKMTTSYRCVSCDLNPRCCWYMYILFDKERLIGTSRIAHLEPGAAVAPPPIVWTKLCRVLVTGRDRSLSSVPRDWQGLRGFIRTASDYFITSFKKIEEEIILLWSISRRHAAHIKCSFYFTSKLIESSLRRLKRWYRQLYPVPFSSRGWLQNTESLSNWEANSFEFCMVTFAASRMAYAA